MFDDPRRELWRLDWELRQAEDPEDGEEYEAYEEFDLDDLEELDEDDGLSPYDRELEELDEELDALYDEDDEDCLSPGRNQAVDFGRMVYEDEEDVDDSRYVAAPKRKGIKGLVFLAFLEILGILAILGWWLRWLV